MLITTLPLWPDGSPNNPPSDQSQPRLTIFQPDGFGPKPRPAIVVCPGGGYSGLAAHEGDPFAALFAAHGMVGAVLTYRVAPHRYPAPQADACRAIRLLRAQAPQFGIDVQRIGIMGFSAGGGTSRPPRLRNRTCIATRLTIWRVRFRLVPTAPSSDIP